MNETQCDKAKLLTSYEWYTHYFNPWLLSEIAWMQYPILHNRYSCEKKSIVCYETAGCDFGLMQPSEEFDLFNKYA